MFEENYRQDQKLKRENKILNDKKKNLFIKIKNLKLLKKKQ